MTSTTLLQIPFSADIDLMTVILDLHKKGHALANFFDKQAMYTVCQNHMESFIATRLAMYPSLHTAEIASVGMSIDSIQTKSLYLASFCLNGDDLDELDNICFYAPEKDFIKSNVKPRLLRRGYK